MAPQVITEIVQDYLNLLPGAGIHPTGAILFGSQITGKADKWSDIDLIVIAPEFDGAPHYSVVDQLWRTTVHADNRIEPIACGTEEWQRETIRPIIDIARREGVMILPRKAA